MNKNLKRILFATDGSEFSSRRPAEWPSTWPGAAASRLNGHDHRAHPPRTWKAWAPTACASRWSARPRPASNAVVAAAKAAGVACENQLVYGEEPHHEIVNNGGGTPARPHRPGPARQARPGPAHGGPQPPPTWRATPPATVHHGAPGPARSGASASCWPPTALPTARPPPGPPRPSTAQCNVPVTVGLRHPPGATSAERKAEARTAVDRVTRRDEIRRHPRRGVWSAKAARTRWSSIPPPTARPTSSWWAATAAPPVPPDPGQHLRTHHGPGPVPGAHRPVGGLSTGVIPHPNPSPARGRGG
jgi:hypothetical protein